ncbi:MAG: uroporphyrinogen-III synthase [Gemmatimonadetes bacterium]|nr:uroporphyrinogen-III synthase [Gemmatimonadota bacterium]
MDRPGSPALPGRFLFIGAERADRPLELSRYLAHCRFRRRSGPVSAAEMGWWHGDGRSPSGAPLIGRGQGASPGSPLAGLAVVVTRPGAGDEPLTRALEALGAEVRAMPMLLIGPPTDRAPLERALERWDGYDWVVFTSPRGVAAIAEAFASRGWDPRAHPPRRLAVVGPTTAAAAARAGWSADIVPDRFDAEGLLGAFEQRGVALAGTRMLLPVAEAARETLGAGLRVRGAQVDQVVAYASTAPASVDEARAAELLGGARPVLVTLTSPSAARNLIDLVGGRVLALPAAAIGPVTGDAARRLGYEVVVQPEEHTVEALVQAVLRWWASR